MRQPAFITVHPHGLQKPIRINVAHITVYTQQQERGTWIVLQGEEDGRAVKESVEEVDQLIEQALRGELRRAA